MINKIYNPNGDEAILKSNGSCFFIDTKENVQLVSQFQSAIASAFEEGINEPDEYFSSRYDGLTYKSVLSEELTKKSDGKLVLLIMLSDDYLV